jgi:hypothetical protein
MGFLDKLKNTAKNALQSQTQPPPAPAVEEQEEDQDDDHTEQTPVPQEAAYDGPTFTYDGDVLPLPPGWDNLSVEDWFFKLETLRERIMHADEEVLAPMNDADGEPLDPEEIILIKEGFKSGGHYEKFRNWGAQTWARKLGTDPTNLEFKMTGIAREKMIAAKAQSMSGAGGALEPVEGVSCETWAHINAALANGGGANFETLLKNAGMDRPKWDRVNAEWLARMSTDQSMAIATVYGAAFSGGSGQGQFARFVEHANRVGIGGDLSEEPVPFERYCEIEAAMGCASDRGEDVNQLLAQFGMNAVDWGALGAFWSKKMQQDAMGYHKKYTEYSAKYKAQYSV